MWELIKERIPAFHIFVLAMLSTIIPWCFYKLNQLLHHYTDPSWKKENKKDQNGS